MIPETSAASTVRARISRHCEAAPNNNAASNHETLIRARWAAKRRRFRAGARRATLRLDARH